VCLVRHKCHDPVIYFIFYTIGSFWLNCIHLTGARLLVRSGAVFVCLHRQRTKNTTSFRMITTPFLYSLLDHEQSLLLHHTICAMATQMRRRSSVSLDRESVAAILSQSPADSALPSPIPTPHINGTSSTKADIDMPPPPRPPTQHTRAASYTPRNPNRLSLNFPIAAATSSTDSPRPTPTSSTSYSFPPTPIEPLPQSPTDLSTIMVAMAGQERRVLELKEELYKAERELSKLKSQYATHERLKKAQELRNSEPLRPLQLVVTDDGRSSQDSQGNRQSIEIERRKSLILKHVKGARRKQFSGSHTRALSLLSPERSNFNRPFPTVSESSSDIMGLPIPRSTTLPDTSQALSKSNTNRFRHSYQGGVRDGAKQIAEDLKSGMWTFLEDLRQATIGDEAVTANPNRVGLDLAHSGPKKKSSKGSLRINKHRHSFSPGGTQLPRTWDSLTGANLGLGISEGGWSDTPSRTSSKSPVGTLRKKPSRHLSFAPVNVDDLDDDWSNWDSPVPSSPSLRWSGSTNLSNPATPSHSSDDRSVKYAFLPTHITLALYPTALSHP